MAATSRSELEQLEIIVQQFRVNELHILLSTFKCAKLGKKNELIQRCISLLRNARNQGAIAQKIREISSSRRYIPTRPTSPSTMYNRIDGGSMIANGMSNNNVYGSMTANPPPFLQSTYNQMDRARNLMISHLPFYDKIHTVLDLTELASNISGIRSTARVVHNFCVPPQYIAKLCYKGDSTPLPRFEIQLRFFNLEFLKEQHDDFPPNCSVRIDDMPVTLPNVIPTNKPNVEAKRPSRPVNITPYCQTMRDSAQHHYRIAIEWSADKRGWAFGIFIVNRLTSDILLRRLVSNVNAYRDSDVTKLTIRNRLAGSADDDGVRMEKLRISLLCPLGKTRMIIPAIPSVCSHLQCFDLSLFLQMNEKRPTWKCPVCDNLAPYNKLIIDGYFQHILKTVDSDVQEVELLLDGGWRPVSQNLESLSDDEDTSLKKGASGSNVSRMTSVASAPSISNNHPHSNKYDDDIIILDDSDEEVQEVQKNRCSSQESASNACSASNQNIICIDLDDSDTVESSNANTSTPASLVSNIPTPQTINTSCAYVPSNQNHAFIPVPAVSAPSCSMTSSQGTISNPPLIRQVPEYTPTSRGPYYSNVYPGPPHNNPGYFGMYPPPSQYQIPPELNARVIEEELRNFMATIHQTTSTYRGGFS